MTDETLRMLVEVVGQEKVNELANSLHQEADALGLVEKESFELADAEKRLVAIVRDLEEAERKEKATQEATAAALKAEAAATAAAMKEKEKLAVAAEKVAAATLKAEAGLKKTAAGAAEGTRANSAYQQRIQGLGYTLNDFLSVQGDLSQRLNAVANNMPMLLAGFGGLGLALSALLPIVGIVAKNWGSLMEGFGSDVLDSTKTRVETLTERIKELSEKPVRLAVDVAELSKSQAQLKAMQEGQAAFEGVLALKTKRQQEGAAAVKQVLQEAGEPATGNKLLQAAIKQLEANDVRLQVAVAHTKTLTDELEKAKDAQKVLAETPGVTEAMIDAATARVVEAQDRLAKAAETARLRGEQIGGEKGEAATKVGTAIKAAESGDTKPLADALRAAGRGDLADQIELASPAAIRAAEKARETVSRMLRQAVAPVNVRQFFPGGGFARPQAEPPVVREPVVPEELEPRGTTLQERVARGKARTFQRQMERAVRADTARKQKQARVNAAQAKRAAKARKPGFNLGAPNVGAAHPGPLPPAEAEAARAAGPQAGEGMKANAGGANAEGAVQAARTQEAAQQITMMTGGGMQGKAALDAARKSIEMQDVGMNAAQANIAAINTVMQSVEALHAKVNQVNEKAGMALQFATQQNARARTALRRAGN